MRSFEQSLERLNHIEALGSGPHAVEQLITALREELARQWVIENVYGEITLNIDPNMPFTALKVIVEILDKKKAPRATTALWGAFMTLSQNHALEVESLSNKLKQVNLSLQNPGVYVGLKDAPQKLDELFVAIIEAIGNTASETHGKVEGQDFVKICVDSLSKHEKAGVRVAACNALAKFGDPVVIPELKRLAKIGWWKPWKSSSDLALRNAATKALKELEGKKSE